MTEQHYKNYVSVLKERVVRSEITKQEKKNLKNFIKE